MNDKKSPHTFCLISPGRWKMALKATVGIVLLAIFDSSVWAFPSYDGCQDCHGGFETNPYTSRHDGTNWGIDLMQGHWPFVDRQCGACHKPGRSEVFLNFSNDATLSKGCVGCHGRDEDVTGNCTGLSGSLGGVEAECGSGAGLRQYHELRVGVGTCNECHVGDAPPVGEHIAPFNYGQNGILMKNSCDGDDTESQFGVTGLDNDGDGTRDGNDPDCQENSPPNQPGTLSTSAVTSHSATVSWGGSSDNEGNPISYQVDYRRNGETPWSDGGSTSNTSQPLSGLDAEQSYDVRVTPNDGIADGPDRTTMNLFQTESAFTMNAGLNDAWFNSVTKGQGFFITVFPDIGYVSLSWFTYDTERPPDDVNANLGDPGHRWLNALGAYSGNQAVMDITITSGGIFDTTTEVTEVNDGTIILTFTDCENGTVDYDIPSINQQGTVPIKRVVGDNIALCETLEQQTATQQISMKQVEDSSVLSFDVPVTVDEALPLIDMNAGLNDAWFYSLTAGQGFFITVFPDIGYVSLSWFTYDTERPPDDVTANLGDPGHRWLNALGTYSGNQTVMDITITSGGIFDTPTEVTEVNDGTIILTLTDCENGTVE
jgi:predicted CXXCH cytochrome family protein